MPRNITVTFENGTTHTYQNAPDDITPEQVTERASQEFGLGVKSLDGGRQPGMLDGVIDAAKNVGTGFVKGLGGLATMAGDAFADDPQTRMAVAAAGGKQPQVGDVSRMVAGMGYQPKTGGERAVAAVASGVGGAMFPGPGVVSAPIKQMAIGGSAGLGAHLGSEMTGGNPIAGLAGGLAGGGAAGIAANLKGNAPALAREALQGVDPRDLERARINMFRAQKAGVPVNLSQAMDKPSNIDTIVESLANSRHGTRTTEMLRQQPDRMAMETEARMLQLPGRARAPQTVANNAQEVATEVVGNAKRQRTQAWEERYDQEVAKLRQQAGGSQVPVTRTSSLLDRNGQPLQQTDQVPASSLVGKLDEATVSKSAASLMKLAKARPNTGVGSELAGLANRLKVNGGWITDAKQLNEILKDASARLKSPDLATAGIDAGGSKFIGGAIDNLRKQWGDKFAPFREANAAYKQQTDDIVNPLKKSVVGSIAGRRGALPDVEATKAKLNSVFDGGTVPGSASSEILKLEKAFRGVPQTSGGANGPTVFQDGVKSWMAGKVSAASQLEGGRIDPNVAANLEKVFRGNDTKAQGFRDMMVGLARSQGKPDNAYVKGMENFLRVTSMAARRPSRVQGLSTGGAAELAGQTMTTAGSQTSLNPFRNLLVRFSERLHADAYKEMDRLLTSPEGVDMLQKLAKVPPTSPAAQTAVATFLGTNASMLDEQGNRPGQ